MLLATRVRLATVAASNIWKRFSLCRSSEPAALPVVPSVQSDALRLPQAIKRRKRRTALESPSRLQQFLLRMQHHQAPASQPGPQARWSQRAYVTDPGGELEGHQRRFGVALFLPPAIGTTFRHSCPAGQMHSPCSRSIWKISLGNWLALRSAPWRSTSFLLGKGFARLAVTIRTVSDRLADLHLGVRFCLLDQAECLLMILHVTRQHGYRRDQLALGIDRQPYLVTSKRFVALLRPWRICGSCTAPPGQGLPLFDRRPVACARYPARAVAKQGGASVSLWYSALSVAKAWQSLSRHLHKAVGIRDNAPRKARLASASPQSVIASPLMLDPK